MPVLRSRDVGDLYIQVVVETPQNLTKRQRELLVEFDQECSKENHPESSGFFSARSGISSTASADQLSLTRRFPDLSSKQP